MSHETRWNTPGWVWCLQDQEGKLPERSLPCAGHRDGHPKVSPFVFLCEMTAKGSRKHSPASQWYPEKPEGNKRKQPKHFKREEMCSAESFVLPQIYTRWHWVKYLPPIVKHTEGEGTKVTVPSSCSSRAFQVGGKAWEKPSGGGHSR